MNYTKKQFDFRLNHLYSELRSAALRDKHFWVHQINLFLDSSPKF